MDLQSFVKETLLQIYRGIADANEELECARVQSDGTKLPKMFLMAPGASEQKGSGVFFDVAVVVKKDQAAGASAKASFLSVVEVDVGGKQQNLSEHTSRIRFAVHSGQWHG